MSPQTRLGTQGGTVEVPGLTCIGGGLAASFPLPCPISARLRPRNPALGPRRRVGRKAPGRMKVTFPRAWGRRGSPWKVCRARADVGRDGVHLGFVAGALCLLLLHSSARRGSRGEKGQAPKQAGVIKGHIGLSLPMCPIPPGAVRPHTPCVMHDAGHPRRLPAWPMGRLSVSEPLPLVLRPSSRGFGPELGSGPS